jgi:hypothetical protein
MKQKRDSLCPVQFAEDLPQAPQFELELDEMLSEASQNFLSLTHLPEHHHKLQDDLYRYYMERGFSDPDLVTSNVYQQMIDAYTGSLTTILYTDVCKSLLEDIEAGKPFAIKSRYTPPEYHLPEESKPYGSRAAHDFSTHMMTRLVHSYENLELGRSHFSHMFKFDELIKQYRQIFWHHRRFVAEDPVARTTRRSAVERFEPEVIRSYFQKGAESSDAGMNLLLCDNVRASLEMLLHWGVSYSRQEPKYPDTERLTLSALSHASLLARSATLKSRTFVSNVLEHALAPTLHRYSKWHVNTPEDLYPEQENLFKRTDDGYTYSKILKNGPLQNLGACPGARSLRVEATTFHGGQEAVEGIFAYVAKRTGNSSPRVTDGTFSGAEMLVTLGALCAEENIYAAWPTLGRRFASPAPKTVATSAPQKPE